MRITANDPRLARCGFARLVGEGGLDFVLRKYECSMGRKSKSGNQDVCLGEAMSISRQHAEIKYNFETRECRRGPARPPASAPRRQARLSAALLPLPLPPDAAAALRLRAECWELHVLGKNGVTVDGTLYTPETSPVELESQSMLQASGLPLLHAVRAGPWRLT